MVQNERDLAVPLTLPVATISSPPVLRRPQPKMVSDGQRLTSAKRVTFAEDLVEVFSFLTESHIEREESDDHDWSGEHDEDDDFWGVPIVLPDKPSMMNNGIDYLDQESILIPSDELGEIDINELVSREIEEPELLEIGSTYSNPQEARYEASPRIERFKSQVGFPSVETDAD
jgi:hypothetical protein